MNFIKDVKNSRKHRLSKSTFQHLKMVWKCLSTSKWKSFMGHQKKDQLSQNGIIVYTPGTTTAPSASQWSWCLVMPAVLLWPFSNCCFTWGQQFSKCGLWTPGGTQDAFRKVRKAKSFSFRLLKCSWSFLLCWYLHQWYKSALAQDSGSSRSLLVVTVFSHTHTQWKGEDLFK